MEYVLNYIVAEYLVLIPVLYIVGVFLKTSKFFNDKYIPLTLLGLAIILIIFFQNNFTFQGIAQALIQGILITGATVLSNQVFKQLQKDKPFLSLAAVANDDQKGEMGTITNNSETIKTVNYAPIIGMVNNNQEGGKVMPVKVYLDAGHGGNDPGAVYHGYQEKDLNLEAILYIGKRLTELGFTVGYSRTTDINPGEVFARGVKAQGYNYLLSIHCNAGGGSGAEVIVNCKEIGAVVESNYRTELSRLNNFRKIYSRKYSNGAIIERNIVSGKFTNVVNDLDWYGILRGCWSVGVSGDLLELFFMDNINDLNIYLLNKQRYWEAIIKSICLTFGIDYQESSDDSSNIKAELKGEIEQLKGIISDKEAEINILQAEIDSFQPITLYQKKERT
ncbi:MAG: N-acetylmuramoyl-L-alanine amidase [Bacilli bacterium]|jgi:N-acetylmuramoyl-L-alanine amidase